jgi:hypothetical protein
MKDMVRLLNRARIQFIDVADAKARWFQFRLYNGWKAEAKILSEDTDNVKLGKSSKAGYRSLGLALAHAKTSGEYNVCRYATAKCAASCVADAGNGMYPSISQARVLKTQFLAHDPSAFVTLIAHEIDTFVAKHGKVAVRLNTFSDLTWETICPDLFTRWGDKVTFYDYTKWPATERPEAAGYDLTRSASDRTTDVEIVDMIKAGERVAVVLNIRKKDMVATHLGQRCVDGDKHDARFSEPKGVIVVLRPKGKARANGFVREATA